jgi:N-acetylmuramoyl-L-alanine amidase
VIDAGHGGEDTGAGYDMLFEKNLALGISKKLKAMSDSKTVEILLTREADNTTTFAERVKIAEQEQVDLFLRLHFNSSIKSSQRGLEA